GPEGVGGVPQPPSEKPDLGSNDLTVRDPFASFGHSRQCLVVHSVRGVFGEKLGPHLRLGGDDRCHFAGRKRRQGLLFSRREMRVVGGNYSCFRKPGQILVRTRGFRTRRLFSWRFFGGRFRCHRWSLFLLSLELSG